MTESVSEQSARVQRSKEERLIWMKKLKRQKTLEGRKELEVLLKHIFCVPRRWQILSLLVPSLLSERCEKQLTLV